MADHNPDQEDRKRSQAPLRDGTVKKEKRDDEQYHKWEHEQSSLCYFDHHHTTTTESGGRAGEGSGWSNESECMETEMMSGTQIETEEELFARLKLEEFLISDLRGDLTPQQRQLKESEIVEWLLCQSPRGEVPFTTQELERLKDLRRKLHDAVLEYRLHLTLVRVANEVTDSHRQALFVSGETVSQCYQDLLKFLGYSPLDALPLNAKARHLMVASASSSGVGTPIDWTSLAKELMSDGEVKRHVDLLQSQSPTAASLNPRLHNPYQGGKSSTQRDQRPAFRQDYTWNPLVIHTNFDLITQTVIKASRFTYHGHHLPSDRDFLRFHWGNASLERWSVQQIPLDLPHLDLQVNYALPRFDLPQTLPAKLISAGTTCSLEASSTSSRVRLNIPHTKPLTEFVHCPVRPSHESHGVPPTPTYLYNPRLPHFIEQEKVAVALTATHKGPRKNARPIEQIARTSAREFWVLPSNALAELSEWNEIRVGPLVSVEPLVELLASHPVWSIRVLTRDGQPITCLGSRDLVDHGQKVRVRVAFADTWPFREFLRRHNFDGVHVKDKRFQLRPLTIHPLSRQELEREAEHLIDQWSQEQPTPPSHHEMVFRVPMPLRTFVILCLKRRGSLIFNAEYVRTYGRVLFSRAPALSVSQVQQLLDAKFWVDLSSVHEREIMFQRLVATGAYPRHLTLTHLLHSFRRLIDFYRALGVTAKLINSYSITGLSSGRTTNGGLRKFSIPNKRLYLSPHVEIDEQGRRIARETRSSSQGKKKKHKAAPPLNEKPPENEDLQLPKKTLPSALPNPVPIFVGSGRGRRRHQRPVDPETIDLTHYLPFLASNLPSTSLPVLTPKTMKTEEEQEECHLDSNQHPTLNPEFASLPIPKQEILIHPPRRSEEDNHEEEEEEEEDVMAKGTVTLSASSNSLLEDMGVDDDEITPYLLNEDQVKFRTMMLTHRETSGLASETFSQFWYFDPTGESLPRPRSRRRRKH